MGSSLADRDYYSMLVGEWQKILNQTDTVSDEEREELHRIISAGTDLETLPTGTYTVRGDGDK